ncbi:MAG: phosphohydrolase, partial [Prevotella sp.]
HRASASHEPRSIYGKIVAEADRDLQPDIVFTRAIQFGLGHYSELGEEEQYTRFRNHVSEKYGNGGYLRLWIPNSPNEQYLKEVREIINDKTKLRGVFDKHYAKLKDQ